ncbi:putative predicted protein [Rhizobium favelukesii]|uniref:Uncharacterized protein n=1 Tax=Rhizobium favelukesii TaxID=348824 RepID=W6RT58_9HYPH|nr:putative predicted protein [Rhizobium favelukesii]
MDASVRLASRRALTQPANPIPVCVALGELTATSLIGRFPLFDGQRTLFQKLSFSPGDELLQPLESTLGIVPRFVLQLVLLLQKRLEIRFLTVRQLVAKRGTKKLDHRSVVSLIDLASMLCG